MSEEGVELVVLGNNGLEGIKDSWFSSGLRKKI
jgi:hypothetical protein